MAGAVIALRESRIVWRLNVGAKLLTLLSVAVLAAYGVWMAAATALIVGVAGEVGWRHRPQREGSLLVGADASCEFVAGLNPHPADLAHRAAPNQTPFVSAFDAFELVIVSLRGKPSTVIVARDSASAEDRRQLGLWLKKVPSAANAAVSARS